MNTYPYWVPPILPTQGHHSVKKTKKNTKIGLPPTPWKFRKGDWVTSPED